MSGTKTYGYTPEGKGSNESESTPSSYQVKALVASGSPLDSGEGKNRDLRDLEKREEEMRGRVEELHVMLMEVKAKQEGIKAPPRNANDKVKEEFEEELGRVNDEWSAVCKVLEEDKKELKKVVEEIDKGSIGGPTLWNLCMDELLWSLQEGGWKFAAFADDLTLVIEARTRGQLLGRMLSHRAAAQVRREPESQTPCATIQSQEDTGSGRSAVARRRKTQSDKNELPRCATVAAYLKRKELQPMVEMQTNEEKVTAPVRLDSQVPVAGGRKGGPFPASSSCYPDANLKTADGVTLDSVKPPDAARLRTDSIGGHSDTSSISTRQKRKRTSDGEEALVENPCDVFLQIENHIIEIQETFLMRTRKEKCKEAMDAVPSTLESIRQLVPPTGEAIKAELVKAVDAVQAGIGFDAIRKATDSVVVEVRSKSDLNKLLASSKLQEHGLAATKRDVSVSWPRVAIFDVPNSFSEDSTLEALASQNSDSLDNRSAAEIKALVKFKFKRGSKDPGKTSCLVIEADPSIREALLKARRVYLGTMRCRVGSFNSVTVCYKCQGLHHTSTLCKDEPLCRKCADPHDTRECQERAQPNFCARCKSKGRAHAHDPASACPIYEAAVKRMRERNG
ncbi:unnamed protein product [Trichogramma brassicae]|uniref:Uncharacterized protein n=1 Tax=Trichogramma brassicae TaxID=86971 RepID=A0A6H5J173_9HYME|nr:unnamed protein product [Trichogramma brassicae]